MKKKFVMQLLSLAMVTSMVGTMVPSNFQYVTAADTAVASEVKAATTTDGINDGWKKVNAGADVVCAVENGWLHMKSGAQNDNRDNPALFENPNTFDFTKEGFFEFKMKSNNENTSITNTDRFGIFLGYDSATKEKKGMFLGYDNQGWFWQKYGENGNPWFTGVREDAPAKGAETAVRIEWTADKKVTLKVNGKAVFTNVSFASVPNMGTKVAFKCGTHNGNISDVFLKDIHYTGQTQAVVTTYDVTGKVVDAKGAAVAGATVKVGDKTTTTNAKGEYTFKLKDGSYVVEVSKAGFELASGRVTVDKANATVPNITLKKAPTVATEKLSTKDMDVFVAKDFPSVVRYEMKGANEGKVFFGQTKAIDTIKINGKNIKLTKDDVKATFTGTKATYVMTVKGDNVDAVLTAELVAKDNTVAFEITKVENKLEDTVKGHPIQTIEIPNHSLVSVNSNQAGANLIGTAMSTQTKSTGDEYKTITANTPEGNRDYIYAFVSNNELSAGLWSNSEHEGRNAGASSSGGSNNTRVYATTEKTGDTVSTGLSSAMWYWHRVMTDSHGRTHMLQQTDNPKTKVIIAGDMNEDKDIDWQDGAVAFRSIMNNPFKCEEVPELVAYRIAMNFGGHAQNPFLTTLDNVKRVAMHTDGLGQSVLLKGYANEGHDSAHPDYADIGKRIGGAKDMNTLMVKGAEYGARFGIHVNAGEMYPEAKAFKNENVRRNGDGSLRYGWNWIDQGIGLDSIYDLATGEREARFDELEKLVGQNLDFVYVDIWGNNTGSPNDDSQQTRKLSKEINDNGWRMSNEWGGANEYDSTFQHWATDLTYGGEGAKGENSDVMRFLRNHQKDSWVGDYPRYGGAAMAPLLGGYNMKDFEGWQGRNDYDAYITNLYTHDVTTKFIQHYKVMDWVDGEPVNAGGAVNWTPEMKITLKDNDGDTLILERGSNDPTSPEYRNRTMTLNGKVIAKGAVSQGDRTDDDIREGRKKGTETYLLPWIWDAKTGEKVNAADEKLYHWNTQGGETTWELPDGWKNLSSVKVYKLTDLGKTEEKDVKVTAGKITLTAESEVPYVVCKGAEGNIKVTWSEGMHIVDAGFNSGKLDMWAKSGAGTAAIAKSQHSNPMMKLDGQVAMTQELTDLVPGQKYAVLVGVDNRSDAKATVTVKAGDKVLDSNYTTRSIAKNYVKAYTHNTHSATVDGKSYFQNLYVYFTAPQSGKVTLTIDREAGEGSAFFDDIRVTETAMDVVKKDADGRVIGMQQNFEDNVQGLYPFVVGAIEGVEDNRTHLSELHAPYTQAGWDVKKMDDVLTKNDPKSNWSIKVNGLCQRGNLVMQTIPQNFHFEEGKTYKVSFDYQAGTDGIYGVVVGNGEVKGNEKVTPLPKAMGEKAEKTYTFELTGATGGQGWFGIYSTGKAPDTQGATGAATNFGGYKDFVLDNLKIEEVKVEVTTQLLSDLVKEAEGYKKDNYLAADWNVFEEALLNAKVVLNKDKHTQEDVDNAYYALKGAMEQLKYADGVDADASNDIAIKDYTVATGSFQPDNNTEGKAELAQDENESTFWHTNWGDANIDNAWYQFNFKEAQTVTGMRYLPRPGAANVNGKLKKVNVQISKDGGKTWETVAKDVVLSTDTKWQKITLDKEYKDVTNVKLIPTETAGNTPNRFAAAAELRVTKPATAEEVKVDKTVLADAIKNAEALNKADYTDASWKVVENKLAEAKKVLANENATRYDVLLATANLNDAVKDLVLVQKPEPGEPGTGEPGTGEPGTGNSGTDNNKPGTGNKPAKPNKPGAPTTGDATSVAAWGTMLAAGLAAVVAFFSRRRRSH